MAEGGEHENPFDPNPLGRDNEGYGEEIPMRGRDRRQGETPSGRFHTHEGEEETSFGGEETDLLIPHERRLDAVWQELRSERPNIPSEPHFLARKDYYGRFELKSTRKQNNVWRLLIDPGTGELNKKLPKEVRKELGEPADEIIDRNEGRIRDNRRRIEVIQSGDVGERTPDERDRVVNALAEENDRLEEENEGIRERLSLKDRVRAVFKKYGLTVTSILIATGTVIGVIVSNLQSGLSKVAKGVGDGLKEIGKKLAGILPGMIGSLVNFLFKTAGEAIGFLAKHAWLLILLVVTFVVEQYKDR